MDYGRYGVVVILVGIVVACKGKDSPAPSGTAAAAAVAPPEPTSAASFCSHLGPAVADVAVACAKTSDEGQRFACNAWLKGAKAALARNDDMGCSEALASKDAAMGAPDPADSAPIPASVPPPRITKVTTSGSVTNEAVRVVVQQHLDGLRRCYMRGLRVNPNLLGRIVVKFAVDSSGSSTPSGDRGGTDLPDSHVADCVVKELGGATFPSTKAGGTAVLTLTVAPHT